MRQFFATLWRGSVVQAERTAMPRVAKAAATTAKQKINVSLFTPANNVFRARVQLPQETACVQLERLRAAGLTVIQAEGESDSTYYIGYDEGSFQRQIAEALREHDAADDHTSASSPRSGVL